MKCSVCASRDIRQIPSTLKGLVSSDCRSWNAEAIFFQCNKCRAIGKVNSPIWLEEISKIYQTYMPYYQGEGAEQKFRDKQGELRPRSDVLAENLVQAAKLSSAGSVLDVGCGNGAFLKALNTALPGWQLNGNDLGAHFRTEIEALAPGAKFFPGEVYDLDAKFDLISLIHCLEHVIDPVDIMARIREMLKPGGKVFIEVPNVATNKFDLLIYDHRTHFTPHTLAHVLREAGFGKVDIATDWHSKEISAIAHLDAADTGSEHPVPTQTLEEELSWLVSVETHAREESTTRPFGIFGTSIAATWLAQSVSDQLDFFVDEDPNRQGRTHLDIAILRPDDIDPQATVYLPFVPGLIKAISARFESKFKPVFPPEG